MSRIMLGDDGVCDGYGDSDTGLMLVVSELSMTILIITKST